MFVSSRQPFPPLGATAPRPLFSRGRAPPAQSLGLTDQTPCPHGLASRGRRLTPRRPSPSREQPPPPLGVEPRPPGPWCSTTATAARPGPTSLPDSEANSKRFVKDSVKIQRRDTLLQSLWFKSRQFSKKNCLNRGILLVESGPPEPDIPVGRQ